MSDERTFAGRFAWIFENRGTNPNALSEAAGLSRAYIRMLLTAERKGASKRPGPDALDAIARAANVSFQWLATGHGPREPYQGEGGQPESATIVRDELPPEGFRRFGDLPGYEEAEAEAIRIWGDLLPRSSWAVTREMRAARWPERVSAKMVYRFAKAWFEQAAEEELQEQERAEIRRQIAAYRATDEAKRRGHGLVFRRASYTPPPSPESGKIARISPHQPTTWTFREYLRLLLQGKYHWIGEVPPNASHADHCEFAERIYRRTRLPVGCDPLWICAELGINTKAKALPQETREVYVGGTVLYPSRKGSRWAGLLVAHGITHHESERTWHGEWTHADEWYATIELLIPQRELFLVGLNAEDRFPFAPEWLIEDYWGALTGQF